MPTYEIPITTSAPTAITVEAESLEQAVLMAENEIKNGAISRPYRLMVSIDTKKLDEMKGNRTDEGQRAPFYMIEPRFHPNT